MKLDLEKNTNLEKALSRAFKMGLKNPGHPQYQKDRRRTMTGKQIANRFAFRWFSYHELMLKHAYNAGRKQVYYAQLRAKREATNA